MALYLEREKIKISFGDNRSYCLNIPSLVSVINRVRLWSSDNYILKDSNGIYLIPKDSMITTGSLLLSEDNYILKDKNDLYLIIEEVE